MTCTLCGVLSTALGLATHIETTEVSLWLFIRGLPFLMKNISGALKLLLCLSVLGQWILAAPKQKKLRCSFELSHQWKTQCRKVSLLLSHLAASWIWRKEFIYYPPRTSPWSGTQGCRQVSAACGCGAEAGEFLLAACLTENKLLPSASPAEHRAGFDSCNVTERWGWAGKWCSEWLLHRLLLANWHNALRFYFYHYFVKPAGNSPFPLFPQASLGTFCVKSVNP